jgi:hypothetical protein
MKESSLGRGDVTCRRGERYLICNLPIPVFILPMDEVDRCREDLAVSEPNNMLLKLHFRSQGSGDPKSHAFSNDEGLRSAEDIAAIEQAS